MIVRIMARFVSLPWAAWAARLSSASGRSAQADAALFRSARPNQMNEKSSSSTLRDDEHDARNDAPRITRAWASKAELRDGDRIIREASPPVRIGRPRKAAEEVKKPVSLRLAPRVLQAARASGKGWQSRAAAAIEREFLGDATIGRPKLPKMESVSKGLNRVVAKQVVEKPRSGVSSKLMKRVIGASPKSKDTSDHKKRA